MHRVRKMQRLYADHLYISAFFALFKAEEMIEGNERVENITLSKRAICESLCRSASGERVTN